MGRINKKLVLGGVLGVIFLVFFSFSFNRKEKDGVSKVDSKNQNNIETIETKISEEEKSKTKEEIEVKKLIEKLVKFSEENQIIIEKVKDEDKSYTFKLQKDKEFLLENSYFNVKEKKDGYLREVIYENPKGEEKLIVRIDYDNRPKLAILIDDVGMNTQITRYFINIDKPLSFAILPGLPRTKEAGDILRENGFEVILHMPMEGSNDSLNKNTKNLVWKNMNGKEIYETFQKAILSVGELDGFNNHMGSRFTEDLDKMTELLTYSKEKGLYFIDSNTNSKRQGYKIAKELGIPTFYTSYFIDNSNEREDIKDAIKVAVEMAKNNDKVLVIGHYRKETGNAIYEMLDYIEKQGVKLVSIKEILE